MNCAYHYFTEQEDFFSIIEKHIQLNVQSVEHIKTGWTNIVLMARTDQGEYFFRFPRNTFFSRMMLKDHAFCSFIRDKVSFQVPNMQIFLDQDRPFSMHRKIRGWSLSERIKHLSRQAVTNLAYDITKFIKELNAIDPKSLPKDCNMYVSQFLDELSRVDDKPYDLKQHDILRFCEQLPQVAHGDLNPGNILLDENDKMVGVLDFAFAGISNQLVDLSRIMGRTNEDFSRIIVQIFEEQTGQNVNADKVHALIRMWNYVEQQYIAYIKANHPEIVLPS